MRGYKGLLRSILIYYGNPFKLRRMQRFYAQFIGPGDLCFDIGAHVGNRLFVWSRLGARVVAVEPQPICLALLRRWYGRRPDVTLVDAAIGAARGQETLWVSPDTPTVTTLSQPWIAAVQQTDSFAHVEWQQGAPVRVITLDDLIEQCGEPVFCKIDVEGYELEVLRGLSQPLRTLSFEYIAATLQMAAACIDRLAELGEYEYNWAAGEQHRWQSAQWLTPAATKAWLAGLRADDGSGDIYARLRGVTNSDLMGQDDEREDEQT
jgi:FkbM family methyltransferase